MCVTAAWCLPRIHILSLEQSMAHLPSTADQYKMPHCHSQYYGKWQLWTNYEQFHGWAPHASWQYGFYDRFGTSGLATHLPYCPCWLTHSLWHIWMFHSVNYRELVKVENRLVQGIVWACVQLYRNACMHEWTCSSLFECIRHACRYNCIYTCTFTKVCMCALCTSVDVFIHK